MPSMDFVGSTASAVVRVESEPPGAEARTSSGQGCRTPCSLNVAPSGDFTVNFALNGYLPQAVTGRVFPAEDFRSDAEFGSVSAGVRVVPDPVFAVLEPAPPPPPAARKKRHARPRTVAAPKPMPAPASALAPAPAPAPAPFPPPSR
jgi:hypothetical protein